MASRIVLGRLEGIGTGRLAVTLPDGSRRGFGPGGEPDAEIHVRDWAAFGRVLLDGETGAGVSYVRGEWTTPDLVSAVRAIIANRHAIGGGTLPARLAGSVTHALRRNTVRGAKRNIAHHYDLGNGFFQLFLDRTMTYSSAVFSDPGEALADAQQRKYRGLAEKARIGPRDHVLEIGCGWGGFAAFAAREIGCRVTAITISEAQARYARARIERAGLADRVRIEKADYRDVRGEFDRIVSIEMLEAVGHANLATWFEACDRLLRPGGVLAVQVITIPDQRYEEYRRGSDFIRRYVFPGGHLPSLAAINRVTERRTSLGVESLENIAPHYAETLRRWRRRFDSRRDEALALGFDHEFLRRWGYYFAYCEAAFASRVLANLQIVLSRPGNRALGTWPYREAAE